MTENESPIYQFNAELLDGRKIGLDQFRGKVLLIVNTASKCGFTPQYAQLEEIYRRYKIDGFEVLGFPCNQFGNQEPGTAAEIASFCQCNYGISFPMFAKIDVNGQNAHPLYQYLKQTKQGRLPWLTGSRISWNFTKFLVRRNGQVEARFGPSAKPARLAARIESLLNEINGSARAVHIPR